MKRYITREDLAMLVVVISDSFVLNMDEAYCEANHGKKRNNGKQKHGVRGSIHFESDRSFSCHTAWCILLSMSVFQLVDGSSQTEIFEAERNCPCQ